MVCSDLRVGCWLLCGHLTTRFCAVAVAGTQRLGLHCSCTRSVVGASVLLRQYCLLSVLSSVSTVLFQYCHLSVLSSISTVLWQYCHLPVLSFSSTVLCQSQRQVAVPVVSPSISAVIVVLQGQRQFCQELELHRTYSVAAPHLCCVVTTTLSFQSCGYSDAYGIVTHRA